MFSGVVPYLPYSKQSKMNKRGAIPAKLIATLMCKSGTSYSTLQGPHI
jgi:phosphoribosylpyrophosphate synthetase